MLVAGAETFVPFCLSAVRQLFTDTEVIIFLALGLPVAFWAIENVIDMMSSALPEEETEEEDFFDGERKRRLRA